MTSSRARLQELRDALSAGREGEARSGLYALARQPLAWSEYAALCRLHRKLAMSASGAAAGPPVRVALASNASTDFLEAPLALAIDAQGLACELAVAPYATVASELLDDDGVLARHRPDVLLVLISPLHQLDLPELGESDEQVDARSRALARHWLGLCERFHSRCPCDIVLGNLHSLPHRVHGNLEGRAAWTPNAFLQRVNRSLADEAPDYVHILDIAGLAADLGTRRFVDLRTWHHAKQPVSFECSVPLVQTAASMIAALRGRSAKLLALDLDNTLWGGVVGDDGVAGLALGQGSAQGEAFLAFQQHVRRLRERGVLLAVCSKNEPENAEAPFREHPESVLRLDDFAAFRANWDPKPDNLRAIARELSLGLDAFVFADDNPVECEYVRRELPEVTVIELTGDPSDFPRLIDESGRFEAVRVSGEDRVRTAQYRENARRVELASGAGDYDEFLRHLEQRAVVGGFAEIDLGRIAQLVGKSNQFNLTTRRLSRSELAAWAVDPERITCSLRLIDRFGDNGLVVVAAGRVEGDSLEIDQWLMSCRVLKRRVEELVCDWFAERARERGLRWLRGVYVPSARNALVREHYAGLGFAADGEEADGTTRWKRDLGSYEPFAPPIEIERRSD